MGGTSRSRERVRNLAPHDMRKIALSVMAKAHADRSREDPRDPGDPWRAIAQQVARMVIALTSKPQPPPASVQ